MESRSSDSFDATSSAIMIGALWAVFASAMDPLH